MVAVRYIRTMTEVELSQINPPNMSVSTRARFVGFAVALVSHLLVLGFSGHVFYQPARLGVEASIGSVDLSLVFAPLEQAEVVDVESTLTPAPEQEADVASVDSVLEPVLEQNTVMPLTGLPTTTTVQISSSASVANDGALWTEPRYFLNRPPRYPREAIARGLHGTVMLVVDIAEDGHPLKVVIERSSGHDVLDHAAVHAVERWTFDPARIGALPVHSRSRVPISFKLQNQN